MAAKLLRGHVCAGATPPEPSKRSARRHIDEMPPMGRRLRDFRKEIGWSQTELAERLTAFGHPCSRSMIDKLEWQERVPSFGLAKAIYMMMLRRGIAPAKLHPRLNRRDEPTHFRRGWKKKWLAEVRAGKRIC